MADAILIDHDALKKLDAADASLIDRSRPQCQLSDIHSKKQSEKVLPPLIVFKFLLLQNWYKLNDRALEKQLVRDLLFPRFTGLDISESVTDHSTFGG